MFFSMPHIRWALQQGIAAGWCCVTCAAVCAALPSGCTSLLRIHKLKPR